MADQVITLEQEETHSRSLSTAQPQPLFSSSGFEMAQRMATALSKSTLIPEAFRNNLPNCLIALEMSNRMGASPMMVMQNLYIVHGRPAWSSQFIIAAINATKRFSPLRFDMTGEGQTRECFAWAVELATGERLEGPPVNITMAKAEGWLGKNGSKWQTMPELMLRYRAATFFGRLYAPEILMGMKEESEVIDVDATVTEIPRAQIPSARPEHLPARDLPPAPLGLHADTSEGDGTGSDAPSPTAIEPGEPTPRAGKKKLPAGRKKAVEPETPPPTSPADTGVDERPQLKALTDLVNKSGYTLEQLFEVAKENNWAQDDWTQVADMPEENLTEFVDDWENAERMIAEKFGKPGEKGPFA